MASRFVTVSEDDILATNEAAVTTSTKKATWLVGVNWQVEKIVFLLNLQHNLKNALDEIKSIHFQ